MTTRVFEHFASRLKEHSLDSDVRVTYRVVGGMPSQRVDYEVAVDAVSGAAVAAYNARLSNAAAEATIPSERLDVAGLFAQVILGLHSLRPVSELTSLPDAPLGSLTIRVDDDEETLYFVPEAEKRRTSGPEVAPAMERVLQLFWGMATEALDARRRDGA